MTDAEDQGRRLMAEKRWEEAAGLFRARLTADPGEAAAHAGLAHCLVELEDFDNAEIEAREAVQLAPDDPRTWMAAAHVALAAERGRAAWTSMQRAMRLAPSNPDVLAMAARVQQHMHRWPEALALAEQGLAFDPLHTACAHIRARALVKMGRHAEGRDFLRSIIERDPDNALFRADLGWTELDNGRNQAAVGAFVDALHADPELEWAREGLAHALPPLFPLYGPLLRYFVKRQRYRDENAVMTAAGEMMVSRLVERMGERFARLKRFAVFYLTVRALLMYLGWIARPISNLLIMMHALGRPGLTGEQKNEARLAGIGVVAATLAAIVMVFVKFGPGLIGLIISLLMISVLSATYDCARGWPRQVMGALALGVLGVGVYAFVKLAIWLPDWKGWEAFNLFVSGTILVDIVGFFLRKVTPPKRRKRKAEAR